MHFFTWTFIGLCGVCVCIQIAKSWGKKISQSGSPDFKYQERTYLLAYLAATLADWLQGPYVYALYASYGFTKRDIGILFIAGFGSSMLFGTFAGSVADRHGRKRACLLYCFAYGVSCATKHSPNFYALLFGRVTGGVATSILYSCFEAWLVANHNLNYFPPEWLKTTFSLATQCNAVVAIASGWIGSVAREQFDSLVAPFDVAIAVLTVSALAITFTWKENKGEVRKGDIEGGTPAPEGSKFLMAIQVLAADKKVLLLGCIQSLFEGSMYIFVFMWTPKLDRFYPNLPHGQVFGCFMACLMIGSASFPFLNSLRDKTPALLRDSILVGAVALGIASFSSATGPVTSICFFVFEVVCGLYFPGIGIVKSQYVAEEVRATVYNIFRIPLNLIVVIVLANLGSIPDDIIFGLCAILLLSAAILQHAFIVLVAPRPSSFFFFSFFHACVFSLVSAVPGAVRGAGFCPGGMP